MGDGFKVKLFYGTAVQYFSGERSLTLGAEAFVDPKSWFGWGGYLGVYITKPICWDNESEPMPSDEEDLVLSRIKRGLDELTSKCRFIEG